MLACASAEKPHQMNYGFLLALRAAVTHGHIYLGHRVVNHRCKRLSLDVETLQQLFGGRLRYLG